MTSFLLSILLILTPLKPDDIPPNWIYLGQGVEPIKAIKVDTDFDLKIKQPSALLTVPEFIRLKSALENSPDLCVWAIDEALKECEKGMTKALNEAYTREVDHLDIIKAYETRLLKLEDALKKEKKYNKIMLYVAGGLSFVATITTTLYIIKR